MDQTVKCSFSIWLSGGFFDEKLFEKGPGNVPFVIKQFNVVPL